MIVDGADGGIQMSEQQMMMTSFIKYCLISPYHHQHSTPRISGPGGPVALLTKKERKKLYVSM